MTFVPEAIRVRGLGAADAVLLAQECLRQRAWAGAELLCREWAEVHGPSAALDACRAAALFGLGRREEALARIDHALAEEPSHLTAAFYKAQMLLGANPSPEARAEACRLLLRIVEEEPEFPGAQGTLAAALFPGPPYRQVLKLLHRILAPETYLEVGVETGATLALANTAAIAVGVDPVFAVDTPLPASARFVQAESDTFFRNETRASTFGERNLDLVFIDGLHWFEQALRDFCNVERWSHRGTVVVFHDCLPTNAKVASRERATTFWTGDTWKVLPVLRAHRPDLTLSIIPTAPSGLLVVRGLTAESRALSEALPAIVERWLDAEYPYAAGRWPSELPLVSNDEHGVRSALGLAT